MNNKEFYKTVKELFFSDRDKFLPKEELGPKNLAILFFSFLAGIVGIGLVFLGQYEEIELMKIIGFAVTILSLLVVLLLLFIVFILRLKDIGGQSKNYFLASIQNRMKGGVLP